MKQRPSRWRVIEAHEPDASQPLVSKPGDVFRFERRPTEWEGWIWCIDSDSRCGWVPENWVAIEGGTCRMEREYTSVELRVREGDVITVEEVESGWAWVENVEGDKGWVPLRCLERFSREIEK